MKGLKAEGVDQVGGRVGWRLCGSAGTGRGTMLYVSSSGAKFRNVPVTAGVQRGEWTAVVDVRKAVGGCGGRSG